MSSNRATLIGLGGILIWATLVGSIRGVSEGLGPVGGAAAIFTLGAVFLALVEGRPRLRHYPPKYLFGAGGCFTASQVFYMLALGYAHNGRQAIDAAMLDCLWPCLTVLFAVIFLKRRANWLLAPGVVLAFIGVTWILSDGQGLLIYELVGNVQDNPMCYALALTASVGWAAYSTIAVKTSSNGAKMMLFLLSSAVVLWLQFFLVDTPPMYFNLRTLVLLLVAAAATGFGAAAWNIGIVRGNIMLLGVASYFMPVLSAAFASMLLAAPLSISFWQGALTVCCGSLLCWLSTKIRHS